MQDNPRRGILLMVATTIIFSIQDGISRYLAGSYDIITIVAIRYWFFAIFVGAFSARKSGGFKQAAATSQPQAYFAKRFAAKEAVYKALSGAGVSGLSWQQAETLSLPNGAPVISLTGQCKTALEALTPDGYKAQISISLSDEPPYALAFVIINAVPLKLDS